MMIVACKNEPSKNNSIALDSSATKQAEKIDAAEAANANTVAIRQLDALEKFFSNDNYLMVNGNDSSYIYFSRLNMNNMFVHSYKMIKGDSAHLKIDTIQINGKYNLQFNWLGKQLILSNATDYLSNWIEKDNEQNKIQFQKIDSKNIKVVQADKSLVLHKTLVLSLFLVRSYYDYQHGTKYAQASEDLFKGKPIKEIK